MPVIHLKLANRRENIYFQALFGTYPHVAWVRSDDNNPEIINVITTPDMIDQCRVVLEYLSTELKFEELDLLSQPS